MGSKFTSGLRVVVPCKSIITSHEISKLRIFLNFISSPRCCCVPGGGAANVLADIEHESAVKCFPNCKNSQFLQLQK